LFGIQKDTQLSNADKLGIIVEETERIYYKDQNNTPRIWIDDEGIFKNYKIKSTPFRYYLNKRFFQTFGKGLKSENLKDAILTFETFAINSQTINVYTRVAPNKESIYVDLCNDKHQSVKIDKNGKGYTIQEKTPPMFKRPKHMQALPLPQAYDDDDLNDGKIAYFSPPTLIIKQDTKNTEVGGYNRHILQSLPSLASQKYPYLLSLQQFMSLKPTDFFLNLTHIVNTFDVERPQTLLSVSGEKGSGKSTVSKCNKSILDPSITLTMDMPKSRDELLQTLDHHHYPCFDNVSYLSREFSDIFCRVLTGAGTSKRMLWTDDEEFIRALLTAINLNGINVCVTREDLLERSILTFAVSISDNRKTEAELKEKFEKTLPYVLHDLYNLVSEVMKLLKTIKPKELFRMADFCKLGCCVAEAMGYGQDFFIETYRQKLNDQIKEAIYNHTLGNVLLSFMEDKAEWKGSSTNLFTAIKDFAKNEMDVSTRVKTFPSAPNLMSRQLNNLLDSFGKIGLELIYDRNSVVRGWTIINHNYKETEPEELETEKLEKVRLWLLENYRDGTIAETDLNRKIEEFGLNPKQITQKLLFDGIILDIGVSSMWGVSK